MESINISGAVEQYHKSMEKATKEEILIANT